MNSVICFTLIVILETIGGEKGKSMKRGISEASWNSKNPGTMSSTPGKSNTFMLNSELHNSFPSFLGVRVAEVDADATLRGLEEEIADAMRT